MPPLTLEQFDLATAFGPVPESARELAAKLDPADAATWVADRCMEAVFTGRRDDPVLVEAIARSALDMMNAILRVIAGREALDTSTPLGAYAFAETAAEVGVPVDQFEQAYRIGAWLTWMAWYQAAKDHSERTGAPLTELIEAPTAIIHAYLVASLSPTLGRYDATRAAARRTRDQLQRSGLRRALARARIDEDELTRALGVSAGGEYVAFAVRDGEPVDIAAVTKLAARAGGASTAFSYGDDLGRFVVWLWRCDRFDPRRIRQLQDVLEGAGAPIGLSDVHRGVEGVGATGRDALEALRMQGLLGETGLLHYVDVRLEAMLMREPGDARRFVQSELRGLSGKGSRLAKLRETAMLWLSAGSHVATAAHLQLHEHTVRNRLTQIEELLGYGVADRRTELLVALRLQRMLEATAVGADGSSSLDRAHDVNPYLGNGPKTCVSNVP